MRRVLEPAATAMAAQRMTDDAILQLGVSIERMGRARDVNELIQADLDFHAGSPPGPATRSWRH